MKRRVLIIVGAVSAIAVASVGSARQVDRSGRVQTGKASFYGHKEAGRKTASGAPLRPRAMTAASPTLPLGTRAKVVNRKTGRAVHVTITDRGPYAKGRVLDVTPKAAEQLGMIDDGVAPVAIEPVSEPSPKS